MVVQCDSYFTFRSQAKVYSAITLSAVLATEWITRNFLYTFDEFPTEEVRRSYEFPEPLRNKYRQIFGELDHGGKYVDPSEFHKEGNLLRDFPDEHGHHH